MKNILFLSIIPLFFFLSYYFGKKFNFFDYPTKRKIHLNSIPYTGGLGLILSFFFIVWVLYFDLMLLKIIFMSSFIFIIGFLDDRYKMNVGSRIIFQILIIFFFIDNHNLKVNYIFDLDGLYRFELGGVSLIFTILCVIFLINAFNYLDGINGLLAIQTIFIFISLIIMQLIKYQFVNIDLIFLILPLLVFLMFNFNFLFFPSLFLGNGGSTMLGFIIAFIFIYYGYYSNLNIDPELLIWSLAFVVFEFLSTNLSRILRNKPIFHPGHDHIHYIFLKKFKSTLKVNLIILLINILFLFVGFLSFMIGDMISLIIFIIFFTIYYFLRERLIDGIQEK